MSKQTTSHILMVRPANFGYNEETSENNAFQSIENAEPPELVRKNAIREFDTFVEILRSNNIDVFVHQDSDKPVKPDAVYPNNWITFHENGALITYPMFSEKRRAERDEQIIEDISEEFIIERRYSFEQYEEEGKFLEGTGSLILDRLNKIVYACLSPRTNIELLDKWTVLTGYRKVVFTAVDENKVPIYHTNVLMTLGETFVVICWEAISDEEEKKTLMRHFLETNKAIIEITIDQMMSFAGNMLQLRNDRDDTFVVMSEQAFLSLEPEQLLELEKHTRIIRSPLNTIERYGGGSARCMIAEIFLSRKVDVKE